MKYRWEESFVTRTVYLLDRLLRFARNLTQKLFDSSQNMLPAYFFTPHCTNKITTPFRAVILLTVRVRGIEPPTTAWKAVVLPLNYTRKWRKIKQFTFLFFLNAAGESFCLHLATFSYHEFKISDFVHSTSSDEWEVVSKIHPSQLGSSTSKLWALKFHNLSTLPLDFNVIWNVKAPGWGAPTMWWEIAVYIPMHFHIAYYLRYSIIISQRIIYFNRKSSSKEDDCS